jgi:hypothetical protein
MFISISIPFPFQNKTRNQWPSALGDQQTVGNQRSVAETINRTEQNRTEQTISHTSTEAVHSLPSAITKTEQILIKQK